MKRIGMLWMWVAASGFVYGQREGIITYEIRINNHRLLPADQEARKAMIPEFRIYKEQLFFNDTASLYKPVVQDDDEESGNGRRRFQSRTQVYSNHGSEKAIVLQELMGKTYVITDTLKISPWKFGKEIKAVQGYDCKQAYYTDAEKSQTVTAWYTDKLRPFLGPDRYNTLPGAVLAVDINNAERVWVATKIEFRTLQNKELIEPTGGQKITQAEYRKMVAEQINNRRGRTRNNE
jgi:GLPGLI family protein